MDVDDALRICFQQRTGQDVQITAQQHEVDVVNRESLYNAGVVVLAQLEINQFRVPAAVKVTDVVHEGRHMTLRNSLAVDEVVFTGDAGDDIEQGAAARIVQHLEQAGRALRKRLPACPVVIMSVNDSEALRSAATEAGALAFVSKRELPHALLPILSGLNEETAPR